MRRHAPILFALVAVFLLPACAHFHSPKKRLHRAVLEYNDGIRWQRWKTAAQYVPPEKREEFLSRKEAQGDALHVTEFEVRDVEHGADGHSADVVIDFQWHRYPSLTVTKTRVRQHWDLKDGAWFLEKQEKVKAPAPPTKADEMF